MNITTRHVASTGCPACGTPCELDEECPNCRQRAARDRVGTTVGGRYRIEELIGRGGFGVVYRATHLGLGSTVALKFLLAEWARQPESRVRFEREAAALVRIAHDGIARAIDFGEADGDMFLVMEWVPGRNLADYVNRDGHTLRPRVIVSILDQVLQVLELAHAQGIVHRDLKPENIMLLDDPAVFAAPRTKVLDFGLVLISDTGTKRLTASNAINGTCYYMAPEQCRGRDVGPPADVYAVGTILYELLTGEPPFLGETSLEVMMQQLVVEPPPMIERGVRRPPPPGLEAIARACLDKNPDARPTASALRGLMRAFLEGSDVVTVAARDVRARVAAAGAEREDRAIGAHPASAPPEITVVGEQPRVLIAGFDEPEGERLRGVLAYHGIRADLRASGSPAEEGHRAILLSGTDNAAARTEALRKDQQSAKTPILVVSVPSVDATAALIRAGASDVLLAGAGDDVLAQRVWRLIRRGR